MFAPLTEHLTRLTDVVREHGPGLVAVLRRYVEAKETEAQALRDIADTLATRNVALFTSNDQEGNNDGEQDDFHLRPYGEGA